MLDTLAPQPPDPLLGITTLFRADPSTDKVDLGVGVYRDDHGITPIMGAVRTASQRVLANDTTKAYVGPAGNREFAAAIEELTLGKEHAARRDRRVVTLQTPGGCGALRLAAELVKGSGAQGIAVSTPTWGNHVPLLGSAGLKLSSYPYLDVRTGRPDAAAILTAIESVPQGTVILLQGSCHNPTGADLDAPAWASIAELLAKRGLVPLVDMAYQGLGDGLDADAASVRLLAERLPEVLVAVSCSKNFGLYRERVGAVLAIGANPTVANVAMGHLQTIARRMYSMPPDHGAALVAAIWQDPALRTAWSAELDAMRDRVLELRRRLASALRAGADSRFDFVAGQRGMFSLLNLPPAVVEQLRNQHHVYLAPDSRMNVAGLRFEDVDRVAAAIRASV